MLVPAEVRPSLIPNAGMGLFSLRALRIGTVVWAWDNRIDRIIPRETVKQLPRDAVEFVEKYATLRPFGWCLCCDNARFINHSPDHANVAYDAYGRVIASRAIAAGEELLENYAVLAEVYSVGAADGTGTFLR